MYLKTWKVRTMYGAYQYGGHRYVSNCFVSNGFCQDNAKHLSRKHLSLRQDKVPSFHLSQKHLKRKPCPQMRVSIILQQSAQMKQNVEVAIHKPRRLAQQSIHNILIEVFFHERIHHGRLLCKNTHFLHRLMCFVLL